MDEVAGIAHGNNAFCKSMHPIILRPAMGKFCMAPNVEEEKLLMQNLLNFT